MFQDGDVLLTYGSWGFWPLRRMLLWPLYMGMRAYQKAKWVGEFKMKDADYKPTHVRTYIRGRFFEATVPKCKWTGIGSLDLHKKKWKLMRHNDYKSLDVSKMLVAANEADGQPYDKGDLLDFAISGLLKRFKHNISLFGDREEKFKVCSVMTAYLYRIGGIELSMKDPAPAFYANDKEFYIVAKDED